MFLDYYMHEVYILITTDMITKYFNMSRGKIIQAPCGSGKSTWINKLNDDEKTYWIDGDSLLEEKNVKNRNYFWYTQDKIRERADIMRAFEKVLITGANILYSGNPLLIPTDLVIIPPSDARLQRLHGRKGFCPSSEQFKMEEDAYEKAAKSTKTIYGDIPPLNKLQPYLQ